MDARYLRVKNWREYQHYSDRRPPWIKLLRNIIDGDQGREFREDLSEIEQYQLIRIWLYASGSETVMLDDKGREVPLIAFDERTLRIGIRTLKRIPLEKFVDEGWLEVVSEDDIAESFASAPASTAASTAASTGASPEPPKVASVIVAPPARARRTEVSEELPTRAVALQVLDANGPRLSISDTIDRALKESA